MRTVKLCVLGGLLFALALSGCAGRKKLSEGIEDVVFSPDGRVLLEKEGGEFYICQLDTAGNLINCNRVELPLFGGTKIFALDGEHNRFFYAAAESVFVYDRTTELTRTLTRGAFARNARCGRVSPDGRFFAFSASLWKLGKATFWRLVVVDAVEGGIVHYCDSLATPYSFQWVRPNRLGYAELKINGPQIDTVGVFFDTKRNVVIPSRDGATDFITAPCGKISYDGRWEAKISASNLIFHKRLEKPNRFAP